MRRMMCVSNVLAFCWKEFSFLFHLEYWWNRHSLDDWSQWKQRAWQTTSGLLWLVQFIIIGRRHTTRSFFFRRAEEEWSVCPDFQLFWRAIHLTIIFLSWLWALMGNEMTLDFWWHWKQGRAGQLATIKLEDLQCHRLTPEGTKDYELLEKKPGFLSEKMHKLRKLHPPKERLQRPPESVARLIGKSLPLRTGKGRCFFKCTALNTKFWDKQKSKEMCTKEKNTIYV